METVTLREGMDYASVTDRLRYIHGNRVDRVIPLESMGMAPNGQIAYQNGELHSFDLTRWADSQLASYANIPKQYYDRVRSQNTELLALMVNHSFMVKRTEVPNDRRLFRSLDGKVQALVSPSFLTLDGFELMEVLQPILDEWGFRVLRADITEKRLYVNAVTSQLQGEVKAGDIINYGVSISTSDVGAGSILISPYLYRLICLNGLKTESHFSRRHIAGSKAEGENFRDLFTSETVYHEKKAILGKAKDTLLVSLKPESFDAEIGKLREAVYKPITNYNLADVVERTAKMFGVTSDAVKHDITQNLGSGNQGAGLTMWGLMNSFTATAKTQLVDADEADRLERIAGGMVDMTASQWASIAQVRD